VKAALQREALSLGFALCRVARCEPPAHGSAFREWLDAGMAGEMSPWLERGAARRMQPSDILPGAQSVIVLALNYFQGEPDWRKQPGPGAPARGRIARYAWGDDYHDLVSARLRTLDALLQSGGGTQRWYVDTGPVLERDHAAAAGIGWHGKSTMLLHPQLGTWTFLAEMLTTLSLEPDPPIADRCGKCTRCLDACPTGAIRRERPHHLDARLCISYLTIESRGAIPLELRPLMGDRIYGCDDCLDACPWNRFAQASRESAFQARAGVKDLALRDYLRLTEEDFRVLFRGSPIKRAKRRGLLRNVCVALGNVGAPGDLPALEAVAGAGDELLAEHAQWAITQIRARAAPGKPD
jgi:epoxyqueuosine reductase